MASDLPYEEDDASEILKRIRPMKQKPKLALERATNKYHAALREAPKDHPWNEWFKARGFDPEWIADMFRLGIVKNPAPGHENYLGWLSVPSLIKDRYGNEIVTGLRFRNPDTTSPTKYLMVKGQNVLLYNLRSLHDARDVVILCEGESDSWAVARADLPVVGIPGASAFGGSDSHRLRLFQGFERVILLQDPDEAGAGLTRELESIEGLEVKTFPAGTKDASEYLIAHGPDALREYVLKQDAEEEEDDRAPF
jgi:hypothetical protein